MAIPDSTEPSFSAPAQTLTCNGLLFDMDGTIIDSTDAIVKNWQKIGKKIGVDPDIILATSHGRRSIDVLRLYEPKLANWDYISQLEGLIPKEFGADAAEVAGSRYLLDQLQKRAVPWAIVTSGTRPLVTGWLDVMNLAHPEFLVTAEDVENGKPDPTCYEMGKMKLALSHEQPSFVVFEDAPAGIRAGKAAGCVVVALNTTHTVDQLRQAGADVIVRDMHSVALKAWNQASGEVEIEITDAVV